MKSGKSKVKSVFCITGLLTMLLVFCIPAFAGIQEGSGEYEIYPTPQDIVYGDGNTTLTNQVDVVCGQGIDSYTQKRIGDTLDVLNLSKSTTASSSNTKLIVGIYDSGDAADAYSGQIGVEDLFEGTMEDLTVEQRFNKYALWISNGTIVILGQDTDAAYAGVTTLKRIFEQLKGKEIRNLALKDYAEIEFRGFIEGYYGNPWSHEDRMDLMKFGGEIKMNQYVFAPKDDPYHAERWRELYPDEVGDKNTLNHVRELAKAGNESKCFYVYALHPFKSSRPLKEATYDEDLRQLKAKFKQVIDAGVRQIAILEDDASANGWTTETLIRLLNDVTAWLEELKEQEYPDLKTDLLFCPGWMAYANNMTDNGGDVQKIQQIHAGVGNNVRIVMTGGKVWGDVTTTFADNFYNKLNEMESPGRYPYLWVNWPCNDNTKDSVIMGGHNGILREGLEGYKYQGIILNPMQDSEPSKVAIFTAADFCWNIWEQSENVEDRGKAGDQAWDDSFKYIDHMTPLETESSTALREIAKHMIAQSPGQANDQGAFDESVEIKDQLSAFIQKMNAESLEQSDLDEMTEIFKTIYDALVFYMEEGTNRRMALQLTPYASSLRDIAQADLYLLDALSDLLSGKNSAVYEKFSNAQASYEKSGTYGFIYVNETKYGQGGRKHIKPFTDKLMAYVSEQVTNIVNPPDFDELKYEITLSDRTAAWVVHQGTEENLTDGDDSTFVWYDVKNSNVTSKGDYIEFDLGEEKPVGRVRAVVGSEGSGDKWTKYHVEYSTDKSSWSKTDTYTGSSSTKDVYEVNLGGSEARYIRLVNDLQLNKWVRFSEMTVYSGLKKEGVYTNAEDGGWSSEMGEDTFQLLPKDGAVLNPNEYVGLKLDRIRDVQNITVTGADNLILEMSVNAKEWKESTKGAARYIRLINKTNAAVTFDLGSFVVQTKEYKPIDFLKSNIGNNDENQDARSLGTALNWMDGDITTAAKFASGPSDGKYVVYDLGQEVDIRSLKVWTKVGTYDYPRAAKFQASLSAEDDGEWQDILVIDGDASQAAFSTSPEENGWTAGEGPVEVAYAYCEAKDFTPVKARYLRLYFTSGNAGRWVELYEVEINEGEYLPPINDPTFETDFALSNGIVMQNLNDNDFTTAFRPEGIEKGSFIYHFSDEKEIGRINILQSSGDISNAKVSLRTGADTWVEAGTLDKSFSSFYTEDLENVYALKVEWENTVPVIYEIITLTDSGDFIEQAEQAVNQAEAAVNTAKSDLDKVKAETDQAESALSAIVQQVKNAEAKVAAAQTVTDKLQAEIELNNLLASQAAAQAVVAEKKSVQSLSEAALANAVAKHLRAQAELLRGEERKQKQQDAILKDQEAVLKEEESVKLEKEAINKKNEQEKYKQEALKKQNELKLALEQGQGQKQEVVKDFKDSKFKYQVISAEKKTVALVGPVDKKSAKKVVIPATVTYKDITYSVVEIKDNAFKNCSKMTSVIIGKNVVKIGKQAFYNCKKLKTINMKKAKKITSFGKNAFKKIHKKAKITVPKNKYSQYKKKMKKAVSSQKIIKK